MQCKFHDVTVFTSFPNSESTLQSILSLNENFFLNNLHYEKLFILIERLSLPLSESVSPTFSLFSQRVLTPMYIVQHTVRSPHPLMRGGKSE